MKKFEDLPIYFILAGLFLNFIMYFYNKVSFTSLMLRSIIVIILFAAMGYVMAYVLDEAHNAISEPKLKQKKAEETREAPTSKIDIKINSDEDDELIKDISEPEDEEFVETTTEYFKKFMNNDSNKTS